MLNISKVSSLCALFVVILCEAETSRVIDLSGEWKFISRNKSISGTGQVPGDIYTDLFNNNVIDEPLYGDNHRFANWVARDDWTYTKQFEFDPKLLEKSSAFLFINGLDTVASVFLNDKLVANSANQFVCQYSDITKALKNDNTIRIKFVSPVKYAYRKAKAYEKVSGHEVPPICPVDVQHGECYHNFIRKAEYSFSWDWAPNFPTVGISHPIQIAVFESVYLKDFSWTTRLEKGIWTVNLEIMLLHTNKNGEVKWTVNIEELNTKQKFVRKIREGSQMMIHKMKLQVPDNKIQRWWPNKYGKQRLYNIKVSMPNGNEMTKKIGFKTVKLVQDFVNPKNASIGRNFYFKINEIPIFLKGSNWVPISMFPYDTNQTDRMRFLLDSTAEAGMNTLRICGVGVYESEEFYDYAAEKGILIWQDLMFSCTLYPMDDEFIENIKTEVRQQIWRLRKHTSILTFNANNENELAIRKHWYKADNYTEKQQVSDYVALYVNVISPIVKKLLDSSHPFLLSSPSNGIETVIEGGIAQNPGDTRFGDIHFYNDQLNLWQDSTYLTPRCATEYGVQSLPLNFTMLKWINEKDYSYMSPTFENRQHGTGQTISNLALIFSHLPIPSSCANYTRENITKCTAINSTEFLNRFSYLSQINHAITLKVQTEHYRRFRNQTNEVGEGNTMCAMYWQLNDVWAAPTPSSIDFELKWKAAHYETRRFFDQLIVALFARGHNLGVTIVSDEVNKIKGAKLVVNLYAWSKGFDPLSSIIQFVDIPALSAKTFYFERFALNDKKSDYLFEAYVEDEQGRRLAQNNYLYSDKFYEVDLGRLGNVAIESVQGSSDGLNYTIQLSSTGLSPFTWIDIGIPYLGWLSDNSFTMTTPTKTVKLHLVKPLKLSKDDFTICNMKNCGFN